MSDDYKQKIPRALLVLSDKEAKDLTKLAEHSDSIILIVQRRDAFAYVFGFAKSMAGWVIAVSAGAIVGWDNLKIFIQSLLAGTGAS